MIEVKIERISQRPDKHADVAEMIYKEFAVKKEKPKTLNEVVELFVDETDGTLPIRFVALDGEEAVGTVSLVENDLTVRPELTPWLASLVVKSDYRSRGVGKLLLEETKKLAKSLGYQELYLRTETASEYYKKNGWTYLETTADAEFDKIDVFKVSLTEI